MSDQVKNFAYSTTSAAVTAGATSFSVQSGHGSRFPATSGGAYNLVVWDSRYPSAAVAYQNSAAEIIRVTTRSTDTFSVITRAQEGTSAIAWGADWRVEMNVTAKNFEDASATASGFVTTSAQSFAGAKTFEGGVISGKADTTDGYFKMYQSGGGYVNLIPKESGTDNCDVTVPDVDGTELALYSMLGVTVLSAGFSGSSNYNETARFLTPFANVANTVATPSATVPIYRVPYDGYLFGFYVTNGQNSQTAGSTTAYTVYVDGSASTLTTTITAPATDGSDLVHVVAVTAGQSVHFHKAATSGASGGTVGAALYQVFFKKKNIQDVTS